MDGQFLIVTLLALAGAAYALRGFVAQFTRSDDEAEGCGGCPANPAHQEDATAGATANNLPPSAR